jgi:hypothetical protein
LQQSIKQQQQMQIRAPKLHRTDPWLIFTYAFTSLACCTVPVRCNALHLPGWAR